MAVGEAEGEEAVAEKAARRLRSGTTSTGKAYVVSYFYLFCYCIIYETN